MLAERRYTFGIRKKMVVGICSVAAVTYATSALFIFYLSDLIGEILGMNPDTFLIATFVLGILWCGILGANNLKKTIIRFTV
jgi:methyl-accepting chemotaxis protein